MQSEMNHLMQARAIPSLLNTEFKLKHDDTYVCSYERKTLISDSTETFITFITELTSTYT
jgi:hypothetical protein